MIKINNLVKSYGSNKVLKDISISFTPGRVTALVGPNASGKTTLIKSILGLIKHDSGQIEFMGRVINGGYDYRKHIGYMPQNVKFPENLTADEVIELIKDIRDEIPGQYTRLVELFNIKNELKKPFRTLSGGTKQKISALAAFMYSPEIFILDEPTAGLDPVSAGNFKDLLHREKNNGKTIILTSHIMSEVEELSDEIVFLLEGKVHYAGTVNSLLDENGKIKLERAIAKIMSGEAA